MKKILPVILTIIVIVAVGLIYVFTRHTHEFSEATCETASTCECGEIQGEPLGHTWVEASCENAKTCSVCNKTDGEPTGHTWVDATCDSAKTCSVCGAIEGEPLEHQWLDATTENPKTCELCGLTEGGTSVELGEDEYQGDDVFDDVVTYDKIGNKTSEEIAQEIIADFLKDRGQQDKIDVEVPGTTPSDPSQYGSNPYNPDVQLPDWAVGR